MNTNIHIVDREDQVRWFLDVDQATQICIKMPSRHHELREWLMKMTQETVVISGQGTMPRWGTTDHPSHGVYYQMQLDQWKIYFAGEQDVVAFKLAWGGVI